MAGLFEQHDRSRFEVWALNNTRPESSAMRRRLESAFDRMLDIRSLSDEAAAKLAAEAEIDILINVNGFAGDHRMGVSAARPVPLQVNYLGFPGSFGVDYVDYIIADRIVIPQAEREFYNEQVVWLPDCYQANDDKRPIAGAPPSRRECGLPENGFVFCNFNSNHKFTPAFFAAWMRILKQVDGSVLWLLEGNEAFRDNVRHFAQERGVAPERLVFAPSLPPERNLARLALAGLALDMLPLNAHTSGSDALWAGLPLLTLRGTAFPGRVAESLLRAVGLPELVTDSMEDYEALAVALAKDPARLKALRDRLAANRASAPLFDTARFTRRIEAAYAGMWEIFQRGESPRGFAVEA
jgi:predicted O-linked N-acetylglucosamine transferase (SPINDLY family)